MKQDAFTEPTAIRAMYQTRGKNSKLNIARAEALGATASQISPTRAGSPAAGGTGGTGVVVMQSGQIADPTLSREGTEGDGSV